MGFGTDEMTRVPGVDGWLAHAGHSSVAGFDEHFVLRDAANDGPVTVGFAYGLASLGEKFGVYRLYDHRTGRPVGNSPFVDLTINRDVSWPEPSKPELEIGKDIVFRMQARP